MPLSSPFSIFDTSLPPAAVDDHVFRCPPQVVAGVPVETVLDAVSLVVYRCPPSRRRLLNFGHLRRGTSSAAFIGLNPHHMVIGYKLIQEGEIRGRVDKMFARCDIIAAFRTMLILHFLTSFSRHTPEVTYLGLGNLDQVNRLDLVERIGATNLEAILAAEPPEIERVMDFIEAQDASGVFDSRRLQPPLPHDQLRAMAIRAMREEPLTP